jgi:hypothetical protein
MWPWLLALALAPEPRCDWTGQYKFACPCAWCMYERQARNHANCAPQQSAVSGKSEGDA